MPSYTVTVATGSQWFAGTDDYIYLSLVGSAGCSEKHLLDKPFYNDFERGAVRARGRTGLGAPGSQSGRVGGRDRAGGARNHGAAGTRLRGLGASSNPSWRPGPGGNPSRTSSGRLGPEVGGGGFQDEALLPRKQEKMQGLLFHRWGLKVLRGPLTGQVLWAALLVPYFLGLLSRLVRGGSHTMNLALL